MSLEPTDVQSKADALTGDRAELIRLLLEKRSNARMAVRPYSREEKVGEAKLPASWAQQRLWFIDQLEQGAAGYQISLLIRMEGVLDREALRRALEALVLRHEVLRTVFILEEGSPCQRILPDVPLPMPLVDLGNCDAEAQRRVLGDLQREAAHARFDLESGPLIRSRLARLRADEHVLLLTLHHVVADGWSIGILFRELSALYEGFYHGRVGPLAVLPLQYADYARWQQDPAQTDCLQRQLEYWRERLKGVATDLTLPTDRPRPAMQSYRGDTVTFWLEADLTSKLKALAKQHGLTVFMVLHAGWAILLSRLTGQTDVVSGTPVANRQRPEFEGLIGFFANTLALRVAVDSVATVSAFLQHVKQVAVHAYANQDVPFEKVVDAVHPGRSLSRNPLFQVMMALQNSPRGELQLPDLKVTLEDPVDEPALFDLFLSLEERPKGIMGSVNFAADLFDRSTVARWMGNFRVVLEGLCEMPCSQLVRLPIMPNSERNKVVVGFNETRGVYPDGKLIHQLFEEQAHKTPDEVAVEHEGRRLTYAQLNRRANQLARYLVSEEVRPDQVVGICVERGLEMVVGLLAILKAGGAYLPLDPSYPRERLQQMLQDAAPRVVLSETELLGVFPASEAKVIALDEKREQIAGFIDENLQPAKLGLSSENLVYVIYTSGSTGRPKGIAMRHRSVVNLIEWHRKSFADGRGRRVLQFAALSFDVAFQEIFSTLCTGGTLLLLDEWIRRDAKALTELLIKGSIEGLFMPPLMLQSIAEHCKNTNQVPESLKEVITAGEQLRVSGEVRELFGRLKACRLHNHYGPTETHVVTALTLEGDPGEWPELPPIGRPITNTQIYVLDAQMQPVPIGVLGEIYIGGANVARGYLNRPELTEQRFVADPYSTSPSARLYKTGDLGRWRADGVLEYLGRNDDQVKIRGFRVELGEIEVQLARHEQVKEAAVVVREDVPGEKRLVAYLIPRGERSPGIDELREQLKGALPEYMVPSAFVLLKKLPLTPSGKLDRRALPAPDLSAYASRKYEALQGEAEEVLAGIWQGLLRVEQVGRNDNFFELGGHSLLIVQMMERLRQVGLSADIRQVYESSTLADLARALSTRAIERYEVPPNLIPPDCAAITPEMLPLVQLEPQHIERIVQSVPGGARNIQDIYPLTPLQEGMLFHFLVNPEGVDPYARSLLLSLPSREALEKLFAAFQATIDRHDVLRTSICWQDLPRPVQIVWRSARLHAEESVLDDLRDPRSQIEEWSRSEQQRLDLDRAPLLRLRYAADPSGACWYAFVQTHHLICDAESLEALFAELATHVKGHSTLLPVPVPYRNHVAQAITLASLPEAERFFRHKLAGIDEPTAPFGIMDVHRDGWQLETARETLNCQMERQLRDQARRHAVSTATLFHAAWALVVARTSGREDVVFGTVLLGRMRSDPGIRSTLGMFINTLPLRVNLENATAKMLVDITRRELTDLLVHEQTSLALVQRCSGVSGSIPLFSSLINYRHHSDRGESTLADELGVGWLKSQGGTNYPLVVSIEDRGDSIQVELEAVRPMEPDQLLRYLTTALASLLEALERAPGSPALSLEVLPSVEREQLIEHFNATGAEYPAHKLVHQLFEEQARVIPDAVAVECGHRSLTYSELNDCANRLAWHLRSLGVTSGKPVGVCLGRSLEMIIGLLAVLKAGGAYVPLDPAYPCARLAYLLKDSAPEVVLTQEGIREKLQRPGTTVLALDTDWDRIAAHSPENLPTDAVSIQPAQMAYIIYTSGSTGEPKGVMVEHRCVTLLWHGLEALYRCVGECQRVALNAPISFDGSVKQIVQLLSGRTLIIVPEEHRRDASMLLEFLAKNRVQAIDCTPSQLRAWIHAGLLVKAASLSLCMVLVGGEPIDPDLWMRLANCRDVSFFNVYGPTECTVDVTATLLSKQAGSPHIGRPMENRRVYILNRQGQPVPVAVQGEICVGGPGLARGYLNRPELTAQKFPRDPFSKTAAGRLYKTGDLGRWRADGIVEYAGRNDQQVKVRGIRVELGEIEAQLERYPGVGQAAVTLREDVPGAKRLVAYLTVREGESYDVRELRRRLRGVLPEYMMPSAFVVLEELPRTRSGKLDRASLPQPESRESSAAAHELPIGEAEESLAAIWAATLGVTQIGRFDNFFELGGHSLNILNMLDKVRQVFGIRLSLPAVFRKPTLEGLASLLDAGLPSQPTEQDLRAAEFQDRDLDEGVL